MAVRITGDVDIIEQEVRPNPDGKLLGAARTGDTRAIRRLVAEGANINAIGEEQYTPLHEAVRANRWETAAELIALGASIEMREQNGMNAFELAHKYDRQKVLTSMRHALSLRNAARIKAVRHPRPGR